ncbi:MAG TPA: ABC transporter ATP-binding protein [Chloroflexota bacterium]|jgi:ATP-binding cassette subfamily B protein|nr:ABC transporter ATP-binding protein [Chloroflexota bacterium]
MKLLIPYLRPYWARILIGIFTIAVTTVVTLAQPYFLKDGINAIIAHFSHKGPHRPSLSPLAGYVLFFVVAAAVQSLFSFFQRSTINRVSRYMEYDLRESLFRHLQSLDQRFYNEMHTGDLMARLTNDLNAVRQFIGMGVISLIQTIFLLVGVVIAMALISPLLTIISMVLMPVMSVAMVLIGRRMQSRYRAVQDQYGALSTFAQESFSGIRVLKAFVQEELEGKAFARQNDEYLGRSMKYVQLSGLLWPLMFLVVGLTAALILFFGGEEVVHHQIKTLGELVQFNANLSLLTWPLIALGWTMNMYQQAAASMQRISEIMNRKPLIRDSGHTMPIHDIRGEVEFRNVSVSYGDQQVLHDVSFSVPLGSTMAIVGRTGSGKSTLVNLIPRIMEADEGQVLIDGNDVRRIPIEVLRKSVGYASQDTFLFSTSLRENVGFGVPDMATEALDHAVDVSRLSKDLEQFPDGLETIIGERGVSLSGGQKQRTSLARAVARDPEILILDDAMSSVDTQTQSEILFRIKQVMKDRTSIIISQRVTTVKDAEDIIVLDEGRVIEHGSHMDLLNSDGAYAHMYRRELLQQELEADEQIEEAVT